METEVKGTKVCLLIVCQDCECPNFYVNLRKEDFYTCWRCHAHQSMTEALKDGRIIMFDGVQIGIKPDTIILGEQPQPAPSLEENKDTKKKRKKKNE